MQFLRIFFCFLFFCKTNQLQAQLVDYVHIYASSRFYGSNEAFDFQTGLPQDVFSGYDISPTLGISILRELSNTISIGIGAEFCNSTRKISDISNNNPVYNLNNNTLFSFVKWNITNVERFISPYLLAGINVSFISIQQPKFRSTVENPNSRSPDSFTYLKSTTYNNDYSSVLFAPCFGIHIGTGLDFKITEGLGLFLQYSYNISFTNKVASFQKFYSSAKPQNLIYHNATFGLRIFI